MSKLQRFDNTFLVKRLQSSEVKGLSLKYTQDKLRAAKRRRDCSMQKFKEIPVFSPGDDIIVQVRVKEGQRERLQAFEGVVIAVKNRGVNSSFTVRKISHGEGVERVFQTHSPLIASIDVKRKGKVRRSKLYYLRELSGRAARIKEKLSTSK